MTRILALFIIFSPFAIRQTPDNDLRQILDDQTAAWNRGDLVGFMQGYWHSPDVTFFSGDQIIRGWESTLQRYRDKYQAPAKRWAS